MHVWKRTQGYTHTPFGTTIPDGLDLGQIHPGNYKAIRDKVNKRPADKNKLWAEK